MKEEFEEDFFVRLDAHTEKRMCQKDIAYAEICHTVLYGRVIERYPRRPTMYPRDLRLGWTNGKPLHVISEIDIFKRVKHVKTVYRPDPDKWNATCDKRKNERKGKR